MARHPALLFAITLLPGVIAAAFGAPWTGLCLVAAIHIVLVWITLSPHGRLFGPVIRELRASGPLVWLTIDDGPSIDTLAILDVLDRHQAKATFFLVGDRAEHHPELVRAIVARGHGIGNHSSSHPAGSFWALPPGRMSDEIIRAQRILERVSGVTPRWFRSVAGHTNPFVTPVLKSTRLTRVSWSTRGYDAVDGNAERVLRRLRKALRPGAIILLHEGAPHGRSVPIIAAVLEHLSSLGLKTALPEFTDVGSNLADVSAALGDNEPIVERRASP